MSIRNIAIIAHVDHGKTTLVDALLKQGGAFGAHEEMQVGTLVMDSFEQERERGITIYAKNASIRYKDCKINIVDTPGHADFGSEVERILRTVDSVLLLIDAQEGPMPQTKFVLKKSLELKLRPIVIINKIDKPAARPKEVLDEVFDLFVALGATDAQLDFPHLYTIAREGIATRAPEERGKDLTPLFELIMEKVPEAPDDLAAPFRMQPCSLGYDNYVGRLAIGRVETGVLKIGERVYVKQADEETRTGPPGPNGWSVRAGKVTKIFNYEGIRQVEVPEASAGDIVMLAGIPDIDVGETITTDEAAPPLPALRIDPPTISMLFLVNNSPFAGKEGTLVTTRHIRERLERERETNVGLHVEEIPGSDTYKVSGRGELHLAVLIEAMRREGFELQVSRPEVIFRYSEEGDPTSPLTSRGDGLRGAREEPIEHVIVDVPEEFTGTVIETLAQRKGEMLDMKTLNKHTRLEFKVPTRGLLGYRGDFIIETRGEGILSHSFLCYEPFKGNLPGRGRGSLISMTTGEAVAFALWQLQERGRFFIGPKTRVYEGMIIGESSKPGDIQVNPTKEKRLSNMRASGSDAAITLTPVTPLTLEQALEYIADDELVEVTPKSIRLRKKLLKEHERKRAK